MTKSEFAPIMAYLSAAVGKPIAPETVAVYFDLLADLPADVLQMAAKRVALKHQWPTFPSAAEIREEATQTIAGELFPMTAAEAWDLAWRAVKSMDLELPDTVKRAQEKLPPIVWQVMTAFPLSALCHGREPVGLVRKNFIDLFMEIKSRNKANRLLPAKLAKQIESKRAVEQKPPLIADLSKALAMPDDLDATKNPPPF